MTPEQMIAVIHADLEEFFNTYHSNKKFAPSKAINECSMTNKYTTITMAEYACEVVLTVHFPSFKMYYLVIDYDLENSQYVNKKNADPYLQVFERFILALRMVNS